MTKDFLIAAGGTGARCLESFIFLAAAGLVRNPIHALIIDPDRNNGNSARSGQLLATYHALSHEDQPVHPVSKGNRNADLREPILFQSPINDESGTDTQHPVFWHNSAPEDRRFRDVIEYQTQNAEFKNFLNLFYDAKDLDMVLDVGYRGRTNIGAVVLKQDLETTAHVPKSGLYELLSSLNTELQNGVAKIFVMGSVFGGTGAASIPILPALFKSLPGQVLALDNRSRLRYGCAMLSPYFSFPRGASSATAPGTDSARHAVATQAALIHYAHVHPGYQHVYLLGAPERTQTNDANAPGGQGQLNAPHYIEMIAALAASDFFASGSIDINTKELHFADSLHNHSDLGVSWETLPAHPLRSSLREGWKKQLTVFTTFAFFYKNFLHEEFLNNGAYRPTTWYKNNFRQLSLDGQEAGLNNLYEFSNDYLKWLYQIGINSGERNRLFRWDRLQEENEQLQADYIGSLLGGGASEPRYSKDGYNQILSQLDAIRLDQVGTNSPVGLFIYLLYQAVTKFCEKNYAWN